MYLFRCFTEPFTSYFKAKGHISQTQITIQLILYINAISFNLKLHNLKSVYPFCLLYQVSSLKRTLLFTVLQQTQEHEDSHRSDSTRLPCPGLYGSGGKSAYCRLTASEETASWLSEHRAAVKMKYMQKHCLHLLWHFLLKPCIATADLCCCLTLICCWCFSIHIVMEIWTVQWKPGHTPISSFKSREYYCTL